MSRGTDPDTFPAPPPFGAGAGPCRTWRPVRLGNEQRDRARVVATVAARFPQVSTELIERAVDDAWESLATAPVRDFVPVLAARSATATLKALPMEDDGRERV